MLLEQRHADGVTEILSTNTHDVNAAGKTGTVNGDDLQLIRLHSTLEKGRNALAECIV